MAQNLEVTYEKWLSWLHLIHDDVVRSFGYRAVWGALRDLSKQNPDIPSPDFFVTWLTNLYVDSAVMTIRRQADKRTDVASLARLLTDIREKSHVISRKDHEVRLKKRLAENYANDKETRERLLAVFMSSLAEDFLEPNGSAVRKTLVAEDLDRLQQTAKRIVEYTHKKLAHLSDSPFDEIPTWKELDDALDLLGDLLKRYTFLLEGTSLVQVEPVIQEPWKAAFTVPWIRRNTDEIGKRQTSKS